MTLLIPAASGTCVGDAFDCEYVAAHDSHAYGVQRALAAGYLPGANVSIVWYSTGTTDDSGVGLSVFAALGPFVIDDHGKRGSFADVVASNFEDAIKAGAAGILGGGTSDSSMKISLVTSAFRLPICSFIAGSAMLSDKTLFPWFFRFVDSARSLSTSIIALMRVMGWSRFALWSESGNSFIESTRSLVRSRALKAGFEVLWDMDFADVATQRDRMLAGLDQLIGTDTQILLLLHYSTSGGSDAVEFLEQQGWFRSGHRVVLYLNSIIPEMQDRAPDALESAVKDAAIMFVDSRSFITTLFDDWKAQYEQTHGFPYPEGEVRNWIEGYACGYSMVAGLHRLVHETPHATLADLAARSPALYQNMNLSFFRIDHPLGANDIPLKLDEYGDVSAAYTWFGAAMVNYSQPRNSTSRYYKRDIVGIPTRAGDSSPIHLGDYVFPGLAPGQIPSDRGPQTLNNMTATSPGGIAVLAFSAMFAAIVLASIVYLHCMPRGRTHPHVRCASHLNLAMVAVACLMVLVSGLGTIDIPIATWVCATGDVLMAVGSVAMILPAVPRMWYLSRQQSLRRSLLAVRRIRTVSGIDSQRPSTPGSPEPLTTRGLVRRSTRSMTPFNATASALSPSRTTVAESLPRSLDSMRGLPWKRSRRDLEAAERLVEKALSGQCSWPLVHSSLWFCGLPLGFLVGLAIWHVMETNYTIAAVHPSRGNVVYTCRPASTDQVVMYWSLCVGCLAFVVLIGLMYALRCWRNPYNASEAKRTVFLLINVSVVHVLLFALASTTSLLLRFASFNVLLLLYFSVSSWLLIVGPIVWHVRKARHAASFASFQAPKHGSASVTGDESASRTARQVPSLVSSTSVGEDRRQTRDGHESPTVLVPAGSSIESATSPPRRITILESPSVAPSMTGLGGLTTVTEYREASIYHDDDDDDLADPGGDQVSGETAYRTVVFDVHARKAVPRHMRSEVGKKGRLNNAVEWCLSWSWIRGLVGSQYMDWIPHELWCIVPKEGFGETVVENDGSIDNVGASPPGYLHVSHAGPKEDAMHSGFCPMSTYRAHLIPPRPTPAARHATAPRRAGTEHEDFGLMRLDSSPPTTAPPSTGTRVLVLRVVDAGQTTRAFTVRFASADHGVRFLALLNAHSVETAAIPRRTSAHDASALTIRRRDTARGRGRSGMAEAIMSRIEH
ncbi:hypothetical protein AMAG_07312 [Allomyces macrogynus ATCC 38327]|uniref:Receptor ligand binding region domain-containing protein n=1 Tax=Allomyces macrogynus (strain ATCC 38327) TaxID=578462 RepID=A0A0L0SHX6_ALLM3|nr:hypothetical protein AMAG_07312 [Allomyces macrogynus ATCC 38327]|eukprot:KNE62057.1 hypothetical protein AMAG_07312 [Allomyces macrogynus ATCC 38327]